MEWTDEGIVLSVNRFGENDAVLEVMSRAHGRARGFVKGGMGRRNKANLQPGNMLSLTWRSRIEANLGRFQLELIHSPLGNLISDGRRMSALAAVTAVVASTMPERESHQGVYQALQGYVSLLEAEEGTSAHWAAALAQIEHGILNELGYGLDLTTCAATGRQDDLIYVSPKSGCAVSSEAGAPYKDKLLALPSFLINADEGERSMRSAIQGLKLTGYFLERNVWIVAGNGQPDARERFVSSIQR
ncbi:DNA repair protein RecO [Kordiimonas aquimaris]|uniref:DNA repair protein RecO n=1 Tax=Kordiimonas aquimaris TaxID=707591 RepID=UPI0021D2C324|nr:DNA repair protein RecO [Kordiimonas aquimaris]